MYEPQLGLTGARTAYFHNALGGYHGAKPRRFEELFEAYSAQQNTGILDFLNVKYILYPEEESGELKPLLNPNALGPAWMVSEIETKATPDALLEALKETDFKTTALVLDHDLPADFSKQIYSRFTSANNPFQGKTRSVDLSCTNDNPSICCFFGNALPQRMEGNPRRKTSA